VASYQEKTEQVFSKDWQTQTAVALAETGQKAANN